MNIADRLFNLLEIAHAPLRVAVVTETYPPEINGVAMTMGRLVEGLLAKDHHVQLIRPKQTRNDRPQDADSLQVRLLRGLPLPGYPGLRVGTPATGNLIKLWQGQRPDIVHIVTEGPLGWSALRAAARLNIATCADFHTNFHSYSAHYGFGLLKQAVANYLKRFHNRALCTMVPTEEMRADLAASGYRHLRVVARGVETKLFHPSRRSQALRSEWGVGREHPAVVHVGRLAAEKNLSLVFTAFEAMRARHPKARLILVGDGPKREHYQRQYPEHVYAGMRRGEDLAAHYASGDIFLVPNLTETFGNVTVEAMASGLAVVAYDYAAARQHMRDGVNGVLVPPGNERVFIERACALIDDSAQAAGLGHRARKTAEGLVWDGVVDALVTTYHEVIARHAAAWPQPGRSRWKHVAKLTLHRLATWDESLCLRFNRVSHRRGTRVLLRVASRLGDGVFWYALMGALLLDYGQLALIPVLKMLLTGSLGILLYKWLKRKISRPRPYQINQDITLSTAPLDQFSFPSGHTLHAVGFSTVALTYYPELAWLLLPFSLLVATSRPVLGLHYPSDVLAGAALGGTIAVCVIHLF